MEKRSKYLIILVLITFVMVFTGCRVEPSEDAAIQVAMIPKVVGSSYFDLCAEGAVIAGEELGMEILYKGPSSADATLQVNIIQDMIFKGVDVILISPIDSAAIEPILKKAIEAGILVVTYDADVDVEAREVFISQVSSEVLGKHLMDNVASGLEGKGQYAILTASMTASNQNTWIQWMKIQQEEKYPNMELVTVIPTNEDQQEAYSQTQNLIQAYPDLKAIAALSTVAVPGSARAIEVLNKKKNIQLYGLGLPNDMNQYLKNDVVQSVTLWNPYELGFLAVHVVGDLLNNEPLKDGKSYGDVGPVTYIERESIVIMGKPLDFTKENIDDYDF